MYLVNVFAQVRTRGRLDDLDFRVSDEQSKQLSSRVSRSAYDGCFYHVCFLFLQGRFIPIFQDCMTCIRLPPVLSGLFVLA